MELGKSNSVKTIAELKDLHNYVETAPEDIPCVELQEVAVGITKKMRGAKFLRSADKGNMVFLYIESCPVTLGSISYAYQYTNKGPDFAFEVRGDAITNGKPRNYSLYHTKTSRSAKTTINTVCKYLKPFSIQFLASAWSDELRRLTKVTEIGIDSQLRNTYSLISGMTAYHRLNAASYELLAELKSVMDSGYKFKNLELNTLVSKASEQYAQLRQEEAEQTSAYYFVVLERIGDEVAGASWVEVGFKPSVSVDTTAHRASVHELPHDIYGGLALMAMANADNPYIEGAGYYVSKDIMYVAKQI